MASHGDTATEHGQVSHHHGLDLLLSRRTPFGAVSTCSGVPTSLGTVSNSSWDMLGTSV
eukprot:m.16035 g.16035  ORF g.16035 m.16035 type:complete len:59 (-) comp3345_c0_seq2:304-480(-)